MQLGLVCIEFMWLDWTPSAPLGLYGHFETGGFRSGAPVSLCNLFLFRSTGRKNKTSGFLLTIITCVLLTNVQPWLLVIKM